jgi:hypothetical protein
MSHSWPIFVRYILPCRCLSLSLFVLTAFFPLQEIRALNERLRAAAQAPDAPPSEDLSAEPQIADAPAPPRSPAPSHLLAAAPGTPPSGSPLSTHSGEASARRAGWRQRMRAELDAAQVGHVSVLDLWWCNRMGVIGGAAAARRSAGTCGWRTRCSGSQSCSAGGCRS